MQKPVPGTTECVGAFDSTELPADQSSVEGGEKVAPREVAEDAADTGGLISIPGHPPFKWKRLMLEQ